MRNRQVDRNMVEFGRQSAEAGLPVTSCPVTVPALAMAWIEGWKQWHKSNPLFAPDSTTDAGTPASTTSRPRTENGHA
jgi:hypothetical protein